MGVLQQFDLSGKTALITGCNKRIGKGIALNLAEAGADITGVSAALELRMNKGRCLLYELESKLRYKLLFNNF